MIYKLFMHKNKQANKWRCNSKTVSVYHQLISSLLYKIAQIGPRITTTYFGRHLDRIFLQALCEL